MGGRTGPVVATVIKILHIAPQVTHPMIGAGVPKKIKTLSFIVEGKINPEMEFLTLKGNTSLSLEYQQKDFIFPSFIVWYE